MLKTLILGKRDTIKEIITEMMIMATVPFICLV